MLPSKYFTGCTLHDLLNTELAIHGFCQKSVHWIFFCLIIENDIPISMIQSTFFRGSLAERIPFSEIKKKDQSVF